MKVAPWQGGRAAETRRRASIACHPATLPLCLLFVVACGGGKTATASKPTMRDSAGVTIVENTAPVWRKNGGWTLTQQPTVSIGVLEGAPEYQLFRVTSAVRLSDGSIVVANSGTNQLRLYDATGHYLRAFGREGGGPGEFKGLGTIFREPGDTIAAFDGGLRRLSLFTESDGFARAVDLSGLGPAVFPFPIGAFNDGSLLLQINTFAFGNEPKAGPERDSVTYLRVDGTGRLIDTVGRFIGVERLLVTSDKMVALMSVAFGRRSFMAVHDSLAIFGANDSYAFETLDGDGHIRRIVRRSYELPPVTDDDVSKYKEERLTGVTNDNMRRLQERTLKDMPFPKTFPAYQSFEVDDVGDLWVKAYPPPGDSSNVWTVFKPDGWMLGDVALPKGLRVMQIGADYVLGLWSDENQVEHVMEYGIQKSETAVKEGA